MNKKEIVILTGDPIEARVWAAAFALEQRRFGAYVTPALVNDAVRAANAAASAYRMTYPEVSE